jgi:hypothetical protein
MIFSDHFKALHVQEPEKKEVDEVPAAVLIALVKNEGDILRTWLSHVLALFDRIYLVDHMSTDGTREYLMDIAAEQKQLSLYTFTHPGFFQEEVTNQLAEIAAAECQNAWIFPLDADEFIDLRKEKDFRSRLLGMDPDRYLRMRWRNCIPLYIDGDEEFSFSSPMLLPPYYAVHQKIALHTSSILDRNWRFAQGNHEATDPTGHVISEDHQVEFYDLLHVPVRSSDHFALKCAQGYQAYKAIPVERKRDGQGVHWEAMIYAMVEKAAFDRDLMREFIAHYGQPENCERLGLVIYSLVDAGWECGALSVAHTNRRPSLPRKQKHLELAKKLLGDSPDSLIERFLFISGSEIGVVNSRSEELLENSAGQDVFGKLGDNAWDEEDEEPPTMPFEVIQDFLSAAFTPHEKPVPSEWESHVPFLMCLLHYFKPQRFVELGTHHGNCFFTACQISRDLGSKIECIAVDTWMGDKHTGMYGENIFNQFNWILSTYYPGVGKFIRKTFDEASLQFEPGSIDLLHIDGMHTYKAVAHDFRVWLPKLSDTGIVMLHDTHERIGDFGVWRLWEEVKDQYPSFEFEHGHGLGILIAGNKPKKNIRDLFHHLRNPIYASFIQSLFSGLGKHSPLKSGQ